MYNITVIIFGEKPSYVEIYDYMTLNIIYYSYRQQFAESFL